MLKVGDFSKLASVTVKTLRHYDELGLLKPVWIDRYTGYRYYALEQLPRLHRILALKDLGFSLAQIKPMLDQDLPTAELRRMFDLKQSELQERLAEEQHRLAQVAERLQQIEEHGRLPVNEVTVRPVPELSTAVLREVVPGTPALAARLSRMRAELHNWTVSNGLRPRGQWLLFYPRPEFHQRQLEVDLALVIDEPARTPPRSIQPSIQLRRLEAVENMACLLRPVKTPEAGPQIEAYTTLFAWAERSGYAVAGQARELLLEDPNPGEQDSRFIEVQLPIESYLQRKNKFFERVTRKEKDMQPKIVDLPAFSIVGMRYFGKNQNQEISQLWDQFNQRAPEIQHVTPGSGGYGVCITVPEAPQGEFEYVASFKVDQPGDIPAGMVARQVPAGKYAVFTHTGSLETLRDTYHYIYQVWLPTSGYQPGELDYELYDEDFKDFAPDSKFYIYVLLK